MFHRYDASINGVSLASVAPEIIICDIRQPTPKVKTDLFERAARSGQRVTNRRRQSLTVELSFAVRIYSMATRDRVMSQVAKWAGDGGWLTVSNRPGERLRVHVDEPPTVESSLKWTEEIVLRLTAYERPYWEEAYPTIATITSAGTLRPAGTLRDAFVECRVTNKGAGTLTTFTATCGSTHMTLTGLSLAAGKTAVIAYTDDDLLVIREDGKSALDKRTADSDDDLIAITREMNTISITADQDVQAVFSARGRYL